MTESEIKKAITEDQKGVRVIENQSISPVEQITNALAKGVDPEQLDKLLEVQMKWEENEARKAYHLAMAQFKENAPRVTKDRTNSQFNSKYTSLNNLVNTVNPELSRHGLSASWDIEQNGIIKVTCKLTHILGHSETSTMTADADKSGAKSPIQQIKSTITYLKSVTFESICGLASSDANLDDDGNTEPEEIITDKQLHEIRDNLLLLEVKESKFCVHLKVESLEKMPKSLYGKAMVAIDEAKKRKDVK